MAVKFRVTMACRCSAPAVNRAIFRIWLDTDICRGVSLIQPHAERFKQGVRTMLGLRNDQLDQCLVLARPPLKSSPKTPYRLAIQNTRISIHSYEVMGGRHRRIKTTVCRDHGRSWPEDRYGGANDSGPVARKYPLSRPLLMIHVPRLSGLISWKSGSRAAPRRGQPVLLQRDRDPIKSPDLSAGALMSADMVSATSPPGFPIPGA